MVAIVSPFSSGEEVKRTMVPWHFSSPCIEDNYTIQRVLGTGHYGVVCAATHKKTGELYAIKSLDKAHPEYNDADVRNEVAVLCRVCDHPNIATLYEVYEDAEHVYLVQEACLGGELFDLVIERKHFTEGDAARVASVLISILAHCHARGVLHRDIKPENFLLKNIVPEDGRCDGSDIRAVDFGLSVIVDDIDTNTITNDIVGSSYYIAPEILAGQPYTAAADAWSLGVVVFILISGYPPFWGSSDAIIYDRIQHQELDMGYEPWNTAAVSPEASDFVRRLLTQKDPVQRMTCAQAASHPWLANKGTAREGDDDPPLHPSIVDRLRAFTRENRLTCLLMTLVAHHLSDAGIQELRQTFYEMDTDDDGLVSVADITKALQKVGVDTKGQSIHELVEGLDVGHNHAGHVNVDEFLAAAIDRKKVFTKTTVAAVFKRLDTSGSGMLSMEALSRALADCGIPIQQNTLRTMMAREGALDGQGVVSARSFQNLLVAAAEAEGGGDEGATVGNCSGNGNRRDCAGALERILSGGLNHMSDDDDDGEDGNGNGNAWKSVLAPRRGLTLKVNTTHSSRQASLDLTSGGGGSREFGMRMHRTNTNGTATTTSPVPGPYAHIQTPRTEGDEEQQEGGDVLGSSKNVLAPPRGTSSSTMSTLDEVLRQYSLSGYHTPRRRVGSLSSSSAGSPRATPTKRSGSAALGALSPTVGRGGNAHYVSTAWPPPSPVHTTNTKQQQEGTPTTVSPLMQRHLGVTGLIPPPSPASSDLPSPTMACLGCD